MSEGRRWSMRAYRPDDDDAIIELFAHLSARRVDLAQWRWKFKQRPSPVENVWLGVDAGDRPIFHYAGIPCRFDLPGGERPAMVSVDALTHPEFRRQGLLGTCGTDIFRIWREAGIDLTLGLPNERWGTRTRFLGWEPLFPLRWQIRLLRPEVTLARKLAVPALARLTALGRLWNAFWDRPRSVDPEIEIGDIEHAGDEFDRFSEECRAEGLLSIVRDAEWIEWRYLAHPSFGYRVIAARRAGRLAGYLAYRTEDIAGQRVGYVAELISRRPDTDARAALVDAALTRFKQRGAAAVFALAVPRSDLCRELRRAGFVFTRGSFQLYCVPFAQDLDLDLLRDPRRWQLSGGDFDVI